MQKDELLPLPDRHKQILELLDTGAPIKVIAADLGISVTRVNQLIRQLKERLGANSRYALVRAYREWQGIPAHCTKDVDTLCALSVDDYPDNNIPGTAAGEFVFSDVQGFAIEAPWEKPAEPTVVLEILDGANAGPRRFIAMILLSVMIAVAIVLTLVTAMTLTQLWSGVATISSENRDAG